MSDIIGFEACSRELRRLLNEIAANVTAAAGQPPGALDAVVIAEAQKLVDFTNRTEPADLRDAGEVEAVRQVDAAADEARRELYGQAVSAIVTRMHDRVSELNQLEKSLRAQAAANAQKADQIRLVPVRTTIDALTDTVKAFEQVKDALSDANADEATVKAKIDGVLRAIAALQRAAQTLFPATA